MNKFKFNQALLINRQTFPLGVREVPEEIQKHPHFQKFLKFGAVEVAKVEDFIKKELKDLKVLPKASSQAAVRSQSQAEAVKAQEDAKADAPAEKPAEPAKAEAKPEVLPDAKVGGKSEKKKGK